MISQIISGKTSDRIRFVEKICEEHEISQFDKIVVSQTDESKKTNTLGIESIREAQEKIFQMPLQSKEKIVIFFADSFTIEAQNALLKILEEPPKNTNIILSLEDVRTLLPTIISRCNVIKLSEKENRTTYPSILSIKNSKIGDKFVYAQTFGKTKQEALDFLLNTIKLLRKELHETILEEKPQEMSISEYQDVLEKLNTAYTIIATTNVSPRFALENLFLDI